MNSHEWHEVEQLRAERDAFEREADKLHERILYINEQVDRLRDQYEKVTGDLGDLDLEDLIDWAIDESERLQAEYTPEDL